MVAIPNARHYTTTANTIIWRVVRDSARHFRRNANGFIRYGTTIHECAQRAIGFARAEQARRRDNELTPAADAVDAALIVSGRDRAYCTLNREVAIAAYHAGMACVITLCDGPAYDAAYDINTTGALDLSAFSPRLYHYLFDSLRAVNQGGAAAIEKARWAAAGVTPLDRRAA